MVGEMQPVSELCGSVVTACRLEAVTGTMIFANINTTMKYLFFPALLVISLGACRSKPENRDAALECYVRYLAPEGEVTAEATLFESSTDSAGRHAAEIPGGIRYQNTEMKTVPIQGLSYRLRFPAAYYPAHRFEWRDAAGVPQQFELAMPSIDRFAFAAEPLPRNVPTRFTWQGEPLRNGESLVFLWEKLPVGPTLRWEIYVDGEQSFVEFPAAKLAELSPGDWTLYLVRRKLMRQTVGAWPLSAVAEYYSDSDTVQVK